MLGDARRNVAAAGVDRWVKLEQADILERPAPAPGGVMIANPPYGERIGSREELAAFYPKLGSALKKNYPGWRCHFFTADMRLPKLMRLQPSRRVPPVQRRAGVPAVRIRHRRRQQPPLARLQPFHTAHARHSQPRKQRQATDRRDRAQPALARSGLAHKGSPKK